MERKEWMKDGKRRGKSVKTEVSQETSVQKKEIPGGLPQNLSDFTLFQSVMKNKEAHEIVREVKESKEWEEMNVNVYSRGKEAGKEIGKEIGKEATLLNLICKKLSKGKSELMIADEVEEDIGFVRQVIDVVSAFAPTYDENAVLGAWLQTKGSN